MMRQLSGLLTDDGRSKMGRKQNYGPFNQVISAQNSVDRLRVASNRRSIQTKTAPEGAAIE